MDGIFHATLVCARLAEFNLAWRQSGILDRDDYQRCDEAASRHLRRFRGGMGVITEHGRLSERARYLLDRSCRDLSVVV